MAGNDSAAKGRRSVMFSCATPMERCTGKKCLDHGKGHTNQAEARACQRLYLLSQGYTMVTTTSYAPPPDPVTGELRPILVLNRRAQRLKPGKTDGGYMSQRLKIRASLPPPK